MYRYAFTAGDFVAASFFPCLRFFFADFADFLDAMVFLLQKVRPPWAVRYVYAIREPVSRA